MQKAEGLDSKYGRRWRLDKPAQVGVPSEQQGGPVVEFLLAIYLLGSAGNGDGLNTHHVIRESPTVVDNQRYPLAL
jgi:hypothetical protein